MTEVIIAILIQLSTLLGGGVPADNKKSDATDKTKEKPKTEKSLSGSGGTGTWDDN